MTMFQILADILFFTVFIQLLIALSLYIAKTVYDYYKSMRKPASKPETKEND